MTGSVAPPPTSSFNVSHNVRPLPDLPPRVHMLGIGGAGLSGAARLLAARGHTVTGADRAVSPFVRALRDDGISVAVEEEGAAGGLPEGTGALVRSAAVPEEAAEVQEALARGLPVLKYSELLGRLAPARRTLAVSGTHGKTTTSWMLYHALAGVAEARTGSEAAVVRPGALVGGRELSLGTNAVAPTPPSRGGPGDEAGFGGWFAAEACEYDRTFLQLDPEGAIVTNVEADHLDYYGSLEAIEEAFARFLDRVHPDGLVVCGRDVPERVLHAAAPRVWRIGRELHVDLLSQSAGCFQFRLRGPGWATPPVGLCVPGAFNVDNAALAIALAVGIECRGPEGVQDPGEVARAAALALERFGGVERRFERWFRAGGVEVIHDYAHHPTEVRVNLEAARRSAPDRPLYVLFQPHQHSRTARFLGDFVEALRSADGVVVTDVYGARAQIDAQAAGAAELVQRLQKARVGAELGGPLDEAVEILVRGIPEACTVLVLGAGDIDGIRDDLQARLAVRGPVASPARR